jgi:hypothetical protein
MLANRFRQLLQLAVIVGRIAEPSVAQFDGMDVVRFFLGTHYQHAASRVAFSLRGEERCSQLPLAGAAQGISFVVRQERLRLRQPLGDCPRDAGEVVDLLRVEPHAQSSRLERVSDLMWAFAIGPGVAEEDIVFGNGHAK